MATSVQVTLVICCTIIFLFLVSHYFDRAKVRTHRERLGEYQRFFAALADIKSCPEEDKSWNRLSSAAHVICLTAPPPIVEVVLRICREMHESKGVPSKDTCTELLIALRHDLGMPQIDNPTSLDFDIVPSRWLDRAA